MRASANPEALVAQWFSFYFTCRLKLSVSTLVHKGLNRINSYVTLFLTSTVLITGEFNEIVKQIFLKVFYTQVTQFWLITNKEFREEERVFNMNTLSLSSMSKSY